MMESFEPLEMLFLAELDRLPEDVAQYLLPPLDDGLTIPGKEPKVGDIFVRIFDNFIYVKIGNHTEFHTRVAGDAVDLIIDVVSDDLVFHFHDGGVDHYRFDEFASLSDTDWNFYVWSGPFRYAFLDRQSGTKRK